MNFLATGGSGCFGCALVRLILGGSNADPNSKIIVFDKDLDAKRLKLVAGDDLPPDRLLSVAGDVTSLADVMDAIDRYGITHILHLAALQVPLVKENPIVGAHVNVVGTNVVLEAARRRSDQIQRTVFMSSAAVLGKREKYPTGLITEAYPFFTPGTLYGGHKQANENAAATYFADYGVQSVGFRPWTVHGVGRDRGMTSTNTTAIANAVLGIDYELAHGGMEDLNFLDDVVAATLLAATQPFKQGFGIFHIPGHTVHASEFCRLVTEVAREMELPPCRITPAASGMQYPIAYGLDYSAIRQAFPTVPLTPLKDAIRLTAERFCALRDRGLLKPVTK